MVNITNFAVKLASAAFLPPLNLVLLCALGLALLSRWPRIGRTLAGLALVLLVVLSTQAGARLLMEPLEQRTVPVTSPKTADAEAIIVLGGGSIADAPEYGGNSISSLVALPRLRYAARLQRETQLPLLVTGGVLYGDSESEAETMARMLRDDFGVSVRWIEGTSINTEENARFSAKILQAAGVRRILLVTDALHMPRSQAIFEAAGFQVVPAPTMFLARGPLKPLDFLPNGEGMRRSHYAMHEWIGIAWYRLRQATNP